MLGIGAKLFWLLVGAGPELLNFFKQIRKILIIQIKFLLAGLFFIYNIFNMALKGQCHEFFKSFFGKNSFAKFLVFVEKFDCKV